MTIGFEFHPVSEEPTKYKDKNWYDQIRLVIFRRVDGSYSQNLLETEWSSPNPNYLNKPWDVFVKEHDVLFWAYFNEVVPVEVQEKYKDNGSPER